jgi:hypothetical protein
MKLVMTSRWSKTAGLYTAACLWAYPGVVAAAADYPCPPDVEVKNAWSYTSTPLHGVVINEAQTVSPSYISGYFEVQSLSVCV